MSAPRTLYDKIWDDHLVDESGRTAPAFSTSIAILSMK